MTDLPTPDDMAAARELLDGVAVLTPMEESRWLSALAGGPVSLKCENLQRTGSFKARGAYVRMARLSEDERANGVVAASAGNHAQGVALAAQMLGIKATVFMPEGAPIPKEKATRGYGAEVVFHGRYLEDALVRAREFAAETGAVLIHPFDHVDIVAGAGQLPAWRSSSRRPTSRRCWSRPAAAACSPGSRSRSRTSRPDVRVVGVQAEGAAAFPASLAKGSPAALESMQTMADGIAVGLPGDVTFARRPGVRRRHRHRLGGVAVAGAAGAAGAGEDGGRAGRRGRGRGAARRADGVPRARPWRCSPAATSTRCCSAR